MYVTTSALFNVLLYSSVLVLAVWLMTKSAKSIQAVGVPALLLIVLLLLFRMFMPLEFSFTQAVVSTRVLTVIDTYARKRTVFFDGLSVLDLFMSIWMIVAIHRLFNACHDYKQFKRAFAHYNDDKSEQTNAVLDRIRQERKLPKSLKIVRTGVVFVPKIYGYFSHVLLIPKIDYTDEQLYYIISHELQHYEQHDLWYRLVLEIVTAIYWWFPVISRVFKNICISVLEYRTDLAVVNSLPEEMRLQYLECILAVSKTSKEAMRSPLALGASESPVDEKMITKRFLLVLGVEENKPSKMAVVFGIMMALSLFVASFLIVAQPHYPVPETDSDSFDLDADAAYIVQYAEDRFVIYNLDGSELGKINVIPSTFENLPIYQAESEKIPK